MIYKLTEDEMVALGEAVRSVIPGAEFEDEGGILVLRVTQDDEPPELQDILDPITGQPR
jgi:hypothetical protein